MKQHVPAGLGLLTALVLAGGALAAPAATPTAPAAAPAAASGPAVPGVCVFSREGAIFGSAAGNSLQRRMKDLEAAVVAELQPEASALQGEEAQITTQANALQSSHTQPDQAFLQRAESFNQRANAFQEKRALRNRELQETVAKQAKVIAGQIEPLMPTVSAQRGCGLIIDSNSVLGGNPSMDITPAVVAMLNTKLTTLSFDRERLQPGTAAAAGPSGVAQAPVAPVRKPATKK